jgi:hypothetical protein
MGHLWSKTRSRGKIIEKPSVSYMDLNVQWMFMKLGHTHYLDVIYTEAKKKRRVTKYVIISKRLCVEV